ncbi:MAG: pirin family protein [Rhodothalassiaceae bacterium]
MTVALLIPPRRRDLGGFQVSRLLPHHTRRLVGPFVFFDEMGPTDFAPGQGLEVRAHPHIGLATLTYLFKGRIRHRDTTGADQVIEPGAVNLMIAGGGIVHSERSTQGDIAAGHHLHGLQLWLALPKQHEQGPASFHHIAPMKTLEREGVAITVVLGDLDGVRSDVPFPHPALMLDAHMPAGASLALPAGPDRALFTTDAGVQVNGEALQPGALAVLAPGAVTVTADQTARLILVGGEPLPEPRHIDWNFVASDPALIAAAREDWIAAPGARFSGRFALPQDETDYIPLPGQTEGAVKPSLDCPTS